MKKSSIILVCVLAVAMGILSCSDDKVIIEVRKIVVDADSIQVAVGKTVNVVATALPENATDVVFDWSSDSTAVATVDQQGVVTGVTPGITQVVVKCGLVSKNIKVEVYQPLIDIALTPNTLTQELKIRFGVAETIQYTASPIPENSTETILWKSSNTEVASVTETGQISAVGEGNAIISAEGSGGVIKKEIAVTVVKEGEDAVQFDSKLFRRSILPGDNYDDANQWWYLESIWDAKQYSAGGSSCALPGPQSFTFDMGVTGFLAYFHLFTWESRNEGYGPFSERNLKKFEVWGSETLDQSGTWDSWTKLMDCEVIKPSGLPEYEYNDADVAACYAGQKFYNQNHYNLPVRYIRVKVIETWGGDPCWRIEEIMLFGNPQ